MKKVKGISLVVLAITIVILMIMTGTVVLLVNNNDIINTSKNVTDVYNESVNEEKDTFTDLSGLMDAYTGINRAYAIGDEVIVGGESFYVIKDSAESEETITVLAKYNLNMLGTVQAENATCEDTSCAFSSANYWQDARNAYINWNNMKLDISTVKRNSTGDAITKAKDYASTKYGTNGRLLTYEEATELKNNYSDIIWGKANQQGENSDTYYLSYWLCSASQDEANNVYCVNGYVEVINNHSYDNIASYGVRPVMTVPKRIVRLVIE